MDKVNKIDWYKLDNNANIFPAISGENLTSVYRLAVILNENINKEFLQKALTKTIDIFPVFKVRLKHGLFWDYFETNTAYPTVSEEHGFPCGVLDPKQNNLFMFRVTYFKNRINLEIFHALTDATGGFRFLQALTYQYLLLHYSHSFTKEQKNMPYGLSYATNAEDSYLKNYKPTKIQTYACEKSYQLKGSKFSLESFGIIHYNLNLDEVKKVAKNNNCTITEYIISVIYYGFYEAILNRVYQKKPINVFVPVNLRPFFNSTTSLNFFSGITISIHLEKDNYEFSDIVEMVKTEFKQKLSKENMLSKLSFTVGSGKKVPVRMVPLPIKRFVLRRIYYNNRKANTMTMSNVGKVEPVEIFQKHIKNFVFLMRPNKKEPIKSSLISYKEKLTLTISSVVSSTNLQREIARKLANDGIEVIIESNGVYNESLRGM